MRRLSFLLILYFMCAGHLLCQKVEALKILNSIYDEQSIVMHPSGEVLYFTRVKHPDNLNGLKDPGDIWYSQQDSKGNWQAPKRVDWEWNTVQKNSVVGFFNMGNSVLLLSQYGSSAQAKFRPGISVSHFKNGEWSRPQAMPIDYFYNQSDDYHISISDNGKILVMSLESYGNVGAEDLYASFLKEDGAWSEPVHLGWDLNTPYQEMTPFLASDNKTLYFSSNGHGGLGSRDIFVSERLDDTWKRWSKPKNLGELVNSRGVEMYYIHPARSEYAYFVSTQNSEGYGDIFQIRWKEQPTPETIEELEIKAEVTEKLVEIEAIAPLITQVEPDTVNLFVSSRVIDGVSGKGLKVRISVRSQQFIDSIATSANGSFLLKMKPGLRYTVNIATKGYLAYNATWIAEDFPEVLALEPITIGAKIQLRDLLFEQGSATILGTSFEELDRLVRLMTENPSMEIFLGGHTDNQGNSRLNIKLSQERVEKVIEYLVAKGIAKERITGRGFGGTQPIASNANEESRRRNRRVEITIMKN